MATWVKGLASNTVGSVASNVLMDRYDLNPYVAMGIGIGISGLTYSGLETIGNMEYINDIIKRGRNSGQLSRPYIDSKGRW